MTKLGQRKARKRTKQFRLENERWLQLLRPGAEEIHRFSQVPFYLACQCVRQTLRDLIRLEDPSDRFKSVIIRERMAATHAALEMAIAGQEDSFLSMPCARHSVEALGEHLPNFGQRALPCDARGAGDVALSGCC